MKYKIFDHNINDYIDNYDGTEVWELHEAKSFVWRKQADFCDEDDPEYYGDNRRYLEKIDKMTTAKEIGEALANFNYLLEEA